MVYTIIAIAVLIACYAVYRSIRGKAKSAVDAVVADVKADIEKVVTEVKDKL